MLLAFSPSSHEKTRKMFGLRVKCSCMWLGVSHKRCLLHRVICNLMLAAFDATFIIYVF